MKLLAGIVIMSVAATAGCSSGGQKAESRETAAAYNVQLGIAYLQQGNLVVAKEKLERAYRQDPSDADVHTGLALLYDKLGQESKADEHYRTALRLAPRNPGVSNNYAIYLCKKNRVEAGVERFLDAANNVLYRTPEVAYTNAGVCLRGAQRDDEAEKHFRKALEIRPNYAEAAYQLSMLEFQRGRLDQARTQLDSYMGAFRATPDLLLLGVRVSRALGDRLGVQRYSRKLRLDFPESEQARALTELTQNPG